MKNKLASLFVVLLFAACTGHMIESQIKDAEELIGTRRFEEAIQIYKSIIARYPNDTKTALSYIKMGDLYRYTFKDDQEALAAYSTVVRKWPFSEYAREAAGKVADLYKAQGRFQQAIDEYEWVLQHFPDFKERSAIILEIAEAYLNLNNPYQAAVELQELLKGEGVEAGTRARALFDLGESYLFLSEYERSLDLLKALVDEYPEMSYIIDAKLMMVECYEKLGKTADALALQQKLVREYPDSEVVKRKTKGLVRREEKVKRPDIDAH